MKTITNLNRFLATVVLTVVSTVAGWAIYQPSINFNSTTKVYTITCSTADATIYYTVDGTDPTTSPNRYKYTEPFKANRSLTVWAVAEKDGEYSSVNQHWTENVDSRFFQNGIYYQLVANTLDHVLEVSPRQSGKYEGTIVIPPSAEYEGEQYTVIRIGNNAFDDADNVTGVVMPSTITSIGNYAFYSCNRLTVIVLPQKVKTIGTCAFNDCENLKNITLNEGLETIGNSAFHNCYSVTSITLPSTLKAMDEDAFSYCRDLKSISIPDGVTSIGKSLFKGCPSLVSVKLPAALSAIPDEMFSYCSSLRSIDIPSTVKSIGNSAFFDCDALTSVIIPEGVETLENSVFYGCDNLLSVSIPEGITVIPYQAFYYNSSLTTVSLPSTLSTITESAFYACSSLPSITIPENVNSIGKYAFKECNKLTSVYCLPMTPPEMSSDNDGNAFVDALERATLYVKAEALNDYKISTRWNEFQHKQTIDNLFCEQPTFALTDYMLTMSTTTAGATIYYTTDGTDPTTGSTQYTAPIPFMQNGTVKAIAVKEGLDNSAVSEFVKSNYKVPTPMATMDENFVVNISYDAPEIVGFPVTKVYYVLNTSSSNYSREDVPYWDWQEWDGQPIQLDEPRYVHVCAERDGWLISKTETFDFSSNYSTSKPSWSWDPEKMKMYLYGYDNDATVYYTLDGSDPTKDSYVYNPEDSIAIDHNLTVKWVAMRPGHFNSEMGSYTISDATLKFVVGPITYRRIDGNTAMEVEVTSNPNSNVKYTGDVVILPEVTLDNGDTYKVTRIGEGAFYYCKDLTSVTLPTTITSIGNSAFEQLSDKFTSISIPSSVKSIGRYAFSSDYLTEVVIPEGVESIDYRAFASCNRLKSLSLPNTLTDIGEAAFAWCSNLTTVDIPNSVINIGDAAFSGCSSLTSVSLSSSMKTLNREVFQNCSSLRSVVIPDGVTTIQQSAFQYCTSLVSVSLPSTLTSMGNNIFNQCESLASVSIPEGVTTLGESVFQYCYALTTVTLPTTLTSIDYGCFNNCKSLRTITIPEKVSTIGKYAFQNCTALESVYVLPTTPPTLVGDAGEMAFLNLTTQTTLFVKASAINKYRSDLKWCQFDNKETFDAAPSAQPTFSFDATNYTLSINSQDANAKIYYTRDNSEPTVESELYSQPIPFMQNDTVKAIAVTSGLAPSLVSEFRKGNLTVPTPTAEINDETFVVTVSCETPAVEGFPETHYFYYIDGSSSNNTDYEDERWQPLEGNTIQFTQPRYLHIYAVRDGWVHSESATYNFRDNYYLNSPVISYDTEKRAVWLKHNYDWETSEFYYTLDGSEPSKENGTLYTDTIFVERSLDVKAVAVQDKHFNSEVSSLTFDVSTTTFLADGIYYRLKDKTTLDEVEVTGVPSGVNKYSGSITINPTVTYNEKEYTVVGIYENAFNGSNITTIKLPEGLLYIGNRAFYDSQLLKEIDIPSTVVEIGSNAFYGCYGLNKVTLREGLKTIRGSAFSYCTQLDGVKLPNTLTTIEQNVFYHCSGLTAIIWPASVNTIEESMFSGCEKLTNITLPTTLTTIKNSAFYECRSLQQIALPESLTSLGSSAFSYCRALTSIVIPNGVKKIEPSTFYYCSSLVSIMLPSQLTEIASTAFSNCSRLASITLPPTLTKIGTYAFNNCGSLTSIYAQPAIPPFAENGAGLESIKDQATLYVLPASKNDYSEASYWSMLPIKEFTKVAAELPAFVFQDYKLTLSTITAGGTIYYTRDGSNPTTQSFRYTEPLIFTQNDTVKAITVAEGMDNSLIAEYKKDDFQVAQPQSTLDEETFKVTITCETPEAEGMPETRIWYGTSQSTFSHSVKEYKLYEGEPIQLTEPCYVHVYAERDGWITSYNRYDDYYSNYYLDRPYIYYDSGTNTITIEQTSADSIMYTLDGSDPSKDNGIKYVGPIVLKRNLVVKAVALKDKHFNSEIRSYSVTDVDSRFMANGVYYRLIDNTTEDVVEVTSGSTVTGHVTIPDKVTHPDGTILTVVRVGNEAFKNNTRITGITLPSTVTSIGYSAFNGSSNLVDVNLPEGITEIDHSAFMNTAITTFVIPVGVKTVSSSLFSHCSQLTSVTIPNGVTEIGSNAFDGCSQLTSLTLPEGITKIEVMAFHATNIRSITLPSTVNEIWSYAFDDCKNLTAIVIPEDVTTIQQYTFSNCSSLKSVGLPSTLTTIETRAFSGCTALESIILPENVTNISSEAFYNTNNLRHIYAQPLTHPTVDINNPPFSEDVVQNATLYVKEQALQDYSQTGHWGAFNTIKTFVNLPCEQPVFAYDNNKLTMSSQTPDVSIYFTLDGTEPTTSSMLYKEPIVIAKNDTIKAMAIGENWGRSLTSEWRKNDLQVANPVATISEDFTVTITCEEPELEGLPQTRIYYSLNRSSWNGGSDEEWKLYTEPMKLTVANYLHVRAERDGWIKSGQSDFDYYSNYYLEKPSLSSNSSYYMPEDSTITITHSNPEAQLYYTLDGSDPNETGILYTGPFNPNRNAKVKAIAKCKGHINSDPEEREYNWFTVKTPRITFNGKYVIIDTETPGTSFYYTTDNTEPDTKSKVYVEPFALPAEQTIIKAIAVRENWNNSSVMERTYNPGLNYCENPVIARVAGTNKVQMTTRTSDAKIYYTSDGLNPTINSTLYTAEVEVTENCTLKAMAADSLLYDSDVTTFAVDWFKVDQPVIAADGIFLTITAPKEGSKIYYTLDGSEPTTGSTLYEGTLTMKGSCTIKAMATYENFNNSSVAVFNYYSSEYTCGLPSFSREGNKVSIASAPAEGTTIYYTTDGTTPTTASSVFAEPIEVEQNITIKALAVNDKLFASEVADYEVNWFKVETPVIVFDGIFATITCSTPNSRIYYTLDGSSPTAESLYYTDAVTMTASCTVKAIAMRDNFNNSAVMSVSFDKASNTISTPQFVRNGNEVTVKVTQTEGTTIYYTLDGTTPTTESTVYTTPVQVVENGTLKAMATNPKLFTSEVATYDVDWFKVTTPVLTLNGNTLTMSCTTPDAVIYYEYDEAPTTKSAVYSGPITLVDNRMVYAMAVKNNFHDSEVATVAPDLFVCTQPTFAYNGRYLEVQTGENMDVHYTLDGSKPTEDSEVYDGQIEIKELCTVRAIAMRRDFRDSPEASYTVSYVYTGEDASQTEPGHLADMFQWVGGTDNVENLPVSGKINDADLAFIRSLKSLRHLDLTDAVYEGSKLPDEAFANMPLLTFQSPKQLSAVGNHLFSGCDQLAAIVWNANIAIPETVTEDVKGNANFLLYVNSRIHVPSSYTGNIISGGQATSITLTDAGSGNFCCPQRFFTNRISYTHTYSQTTESGVTCGWETLALPFDVQSITHERRGAMAPFSAQEDYSLYKPFWLYELQETGFSDATEVKAYTPYIISMPNNPNYADDFILAGKVTFSAADTYIEVDTAMVTMKGSVRFAPAMQRQEKSSTVLAINLEDCTVDGTFYRSGSAFLPNLRTVNPFEAYALVGASVPKIPLVDMEWGYVTDMRNAQMSELEVIGRKGGVYDLLGRKLSNDSSNLKNDGGKMKRVYIINGKKTVVE